LTLARRWADDERYRLRGEPTPDEVEAEEWRRIQSTSDPRPLEDQIALVLENGRRNGWSNGYADPVDFLSSALPKEIRRKPLGEIDPEECVRALVRLPFSIHRIDTLRAFTSKLSSRELSAGAGAKVTARETTAAYYRTLEEDWSPDFQSRPNVSEPYVSPVLHALRRDAAWVPAMALSMYLGTGARQAPLLTARRSAIIEDEWYPYSPGRRSNWSFAGERLEPDLLADLQGHRRRVREEFRVTDLLFRTRTDVGTLVSITSLWRCFRRALRDAGWKGARGGRRAFAMVAHPGLWIGRNNVAVRAFTQAHEAEEQRVSRYLSSGWGSPPKPIA
jgi:hypothetical protein